MAGNKKSKYAAELARLKALNAIKEVLKKSDIENAALTNTSKDSETLSDNTLNNMLNELNLERNSTKDLEIVENLALQTRDGRLALKNRRIKIRKSGRKIKIRKKIHVLKRPKSKGKRSRKKR